jgi:hypothetical protein
MPATVPTSEFTGEWKDSTGVVWLTRTLIDPFFKRDWDRKRPEQPWPWPCYGPEYQIAWPRLRKFRIEVESCTAPKVPGRIRAMRINAGPRRAHVKACARAIVWVHHSDDVKELAKAPEIKQAYQEAERQQDAKGRWIIAPRLVAERLGIDGSLVHTYRNKGIPWLDGRKPESVWVKYGHYGREVPFWLESEVDQFKSALDALPVAAPEGLIPVGEVKGMSLRTLSKMERVEVPRKVFRTEKRKGKPRKVAYTVRRRLIPAEDLTEYRRAHSQDSRPPDMMTVREIAHLFQVFDVQVLSLFPPSARRRGKVLCLYRTRRGKTMSQVRDGYYIPVPKVRRMWEKLRPGQPWPLANAGDPRGTRAPGDAAEQDVRPAAEAHQPEKGTNVTVPAADLAPNPSETACEILDNLYRFQAFDSARCASLSDIADRQRINAGTLRKHVAPLKELRLVDSKEGRGGGVWLTPAGREFVEKHRL